MKKLKVKEKLKKSLLVTIALIMVTFMMPIKSRADILNDFIDLILRIPDGALSIVDKFIGGSEEFTYEQLEFRGGWDEGGRLYNFIVTPYDIFSSGTYEDKDGAYYTKLGILDINFFADRDIQSETPYVSSKILAPVIGNVYKGLRNLCMVLMLLVILYIGIKILISSIAAQQAKYKQLLVDWLVGFALLFIMHYIMSGIVYLNSVVVKMLSNSEGDAYYVGIAELEDDVNIGTSIGNNVNAGSSDSTWFDVAWNMANDVFWDKASVHNGMKYNGERYQKFKDTRLAVRNSTSETETFSDYIDSDGRIDLNSVPQGKQGATSLAGTTASTLNVGYTSISPVEIKKWGQNGVIYLSASIINPGDDNDKYENKAIVRLNAMSYTRTIASFGSEDNDSVILYSNGGTVSMHGEWMDVMGYSILYLCLAIETIMFTFTYIKRVLQMSFLTMIAPIVAIMYPVDKIGDGKAQAFNTWFKDYLFNILIQPMHLLLYTVFFVAASELVSRNIIYALAVYGFMIPAEKYFKKILGFDKASTGGGGPLGGAIGHGLAMDGLGKLTGIGPAGKGGGSSKDGSKKHRKMKLPKNTPTGSGGGPSSGGGGSSSGGNGPASNGGAGQSSRSGASNSSGNGGQRRSQPSSGGGGGRPSASGGKKGFWPALGRSIGRKVIKGASNGKYSTLGDAGVTRDRAGKINGGRLKAAGNIVGSMAGSGLKLVAKKGSRLAVRGAGAIAMGAVGTVAGAATAMATGDINNLWKGATIGAGAGNKIGSNAYDRSEEFFTDFANDVKADRAANDDDYNAKLRKEEARKDYQDAFDELPEGEDKQHLREARDQYSPYIDLNGDMDALKALSAIDDDFETVRHIPRNQSIKEKVEIYQDAKSWGDLKDSKRAADYEKYLTDSVAAGGAGLNPAQAKERLRIAKIAQKELGK